MTVELEGQMPSQGRSQRGFATSQPDGIPNSYLKLVKN